MLNPKISFVIDPYTIDDYSEKQWDNHGACYVYFQYPNGIRKEEELTRLYQKHWIILKRKNNIYK